jgi:hypothetical protein
MSLDAWKRLLSGSVSYKKLLDGILRVAAPPPADLAAEVASKLAAQPLPLRVLLAKEDGTAVAAADVWASEPFAQIRQRTPVPDYVDSDSHTFARPGDEEALLQAVLRGLKA